MVEVESESTRRDDVTFVTVVIRNTRGTAQRVTIESTIDGPIWTPGTGLADSPDWDGRTWQGVVEPGRTRGVGFATPTAPPSGEDAVELVGCKRAPEEERADPREVIASLESWTPTGDAFVEQ